MLRVLDIVRGTVVDGPGLRTSIYFAGCKHHCRGCHNPESWDFEGGEDKSVEEILRLIQEDMFDVTFSGGDPLFQNVDELVALAKEIKKIGLEIWVYTGFTIEKILEMGTYDELLKYIDVLVDGPFILEKKNSSLSFRGSSNQRILKLFCGENGGKNVHYEKLFFEN